MGIKFSSSDSEALIQAMKNNVVIANQITDRLSSGCEHLIASLDSGELSGAAYTAGRGLFSDIIIPSINKLRSAVDDIEAELVSYQYAHSTIAEFGTLDMDQLKEQLDIKYEMLDQVEEQIRINNAFLAQATALLTGNTFKLWENNNALDRLKSHLEIGIREIEEKIEKLDWFVSDVSRYFSDSLNVLNLAMEGAKSLSQILVDGNGNYYTIGLNMGWLAQLKGSKISTFGRGEDIKSSLIQQNAQNFMLSDEGFSYYRNQVIAILKDKPQDEWPSIIQAYNKSLLFDEDGNILHISELQTPEGGLWVVLKNGKVDNPYTQRLNQEINGQFWASLGDNGLKILGGIASILGGTTVFGGSSALSAAGLVLSLPSGGTVTIPAAALASLGFALSGSMVTGGTLAVSDGISNIAAANAKLTVSFAKGPDERAQSSNNNLSNTNYNIENPESFNNAKITDVEQFLDQYLKGFKKSPLKRGDGVRYYDGRGNSWQLNNGYSNASDTLHGGPYLKTTYNGKVIRIPLSK
jgi:hypothetical protein